MTQYKADKTFLTLPSLKLSPKEKQNEVSYRPPPVKAYNYSCELCLQGANSSDVLKCTLCNVVAHSSCAKKSGGFGSNLPCTKWVCFYCLESRLYEVDYKRKMLAREEAAKKKELAQIVICRFWRKAKLIKVYERIRRGLIIFQRLYRTSRRKHLFFQKKQSRLRPIKIAVRNLSQLTFIPYEPKTGNTGTASGNKRQFQIYVLVCVVDLTSGTSIQSWRIESSAKTVKSNTANCYDVKIDEEFLLGGVSGTQHIVLSVFQKGLNSKDLFLGQASIELAHDMIWRKGGNFLSPLTEAMYDIKDNSGMLMKCEPRQMPAGLLEYEIITSHGMTTTCCTCYGTSPEDFLRLLLKSDADLPGYSVHHRAVQGRLFDPSKSLSSSSRSSSNSSLTSISGSSSALSPTPYVSEKVTTMRKMWIAMFMEKIYVFSHFGDQLKLVIDLKFLNIQYELMKNKDKLIYRIQSGSRSGLPDFQFYPYYDHEMFLMKCTILSSVTLAKKMFMKLDRVPNEIKLPNLKPPLSPYAAPSRLPSPRIGKTPRIKEDESIQDDKYELNVFLAKWTALEMMKNPDMRMKKLNSFPRNNRIKIHPTTLSSSSADSYFSASTTPSKPSSSQQKFRTPPPLITQRSSSNRGFTLSSSTDLDDDYSYEDEIPNDPFLHFSISSSSSVVFEDDKDMPSIDTLEENDGFDSPLFTAREDEDKMEGLIKKSPLTRFYENNPITAKFASPVKGLSVSTSLSAVKLPAIK
jgi:hypothetical protein